MKKKPRIFIVRTKMSRKQKEIQNQADQEHPKKRKKHLRKKDRVDQIIRIEELEELMKSIRKQSSVCICRIESGGGSVQHCFSWTG